MTEKHFNLKEAEELLPSIEPCLEQARSHKQKVASLDAEFAQAAARIMMAGGMRPPYTELARKRAERDHGARLLQEAINKIHETGCLVKDVDQGLVDFPSLREGEEVYLCWKLGEAHIGYWHGIHEGFAGRKPLGKPGSPEGPPDKKRVQ